MHELFFKMNEPRKTTIVVVTHNAALWPAGMPRVVTLRDGKVERDERRNATGYREVAAEAATSELAARVKSTYPRDPGVSSARSAVRRRRITPGRWHRGEAREARGGAPLVWYVAGCDEHFDRCFGARIFRRVCPSLDARAKARAVAAVKAFEAETSAELVVTVKKHARTYPEVHLLYGSVFALVTLLFLLFYPLDFSTTMA